MTPEQKIMVHDTYEQIRPIALEASALFYSRLFELRPELRPMFQADMSAQALKLLAMLHVVVANLDRPALITPLVRQLGVRHRAYGVKPEHYYAVGSALIWTLEAGLGASFTPAAREACVVAFNLLASAMQDARGSPNSAT